MVPSEAVTAMVQDHFQDHQGVPPVVLVLKMMLAVVQEVRDHRPPLPLLPPPPETTVTVFMSGKQLGVVEPHQQEV